MKKYFIPFLFVFCANVFAIGDEKPINLNDFVVRVAQSLYQYDDQHVDHYLQNIKVFFTERGYRRFRHALAASKNIEFVKRHQMHVTNELVSVPQLEKTLGENQWLYRTKLKVTFSNGMKTKQNVVWVLTKLVQRQGEYSKQIAVDKVVVYPADQQA